MAVQDVKDGIDVLEIWKVSGITVILAACVNVLIQHWVASWKEKRVRKEELDYQALRVALALEKFAIACAGIVSDANIHEETNGAVGQKYTALPDIPISEAVQWKLFETQVVNEILSFENTIADANNSIAFHLNVSNLQEDTEEAELQAGLCGYMAHQIAERLRKKYDLGIRWLPVHGWDHVNQLKNMHDRKKAAYRASRPPIA